MLSLSSLFKYLEATPDSRNICEGEQVVNSGHIILCGKQNSQEKDTINIFGLCLQSSSINNYPHEIKGEIKLEQINFKVKTMHCSCKAGNSGRCKHIAAILINCTRYNLNELENVSSTDMKCIWNQRKEATLSNYKPLPLLSTRCLENKIIQSSLNNKNYNKKLEEACPNSIIVKHKNRLNSQTIEVLETTQKIAINSSLTEIFNSCAQSIIMMELNSSNDLVMLKPCCQNIYNKNYLSSDVVEIENVSKQNSIRWHRERQFRITGSRIYDLFTYSKGEWDMKAMKYFWPKRFTNVYVKHGIATENVAREKYKTLYNVHVVETGFIVCYDNPWLGYSPDGIIFEGNKPSKLLEIKCPYDKNDGFDFTALPYLVNKNSEWMLKKKHKYYGQIQLGMAVLNLQCCDLFIYLSKDERFLNIPILYDEDFCKNMLFHIKSKFFNNMIHYLCLNT